MPSNQQMPEQKQQAGGRLSGPDAGWRNMLRNLDAARAIAAAETAAHSQDTPPPPTRTD